MQVILICEASLTFFLLKMIFLVSRSAFSVFLISMAFIFNVICWNLAAKIGIISFYIPKIIPLTVYFSGANDLLVSSCIEKIINLGRIWRGA